MIDLPILNIAFSAPMVQALLAGRKTQTRPVLEPQPTRPGVFQGIRPRTRYALFNPVSGAEVKDCEHLRLPYAPGDRLWVKEAWRTHEIYDLKPPRNIPSSAPVQYPADCSLRPFAGRYRHAWFMPRWASRLTLRVTDVRVKRVQDISEADAIAEGVDAVTMDDVPRQAATSRRSDFSALWNSIHGPDAWGRNYWVAAVTFTVEEG